MVRPIDLCEQAHVLMGDGTPRMGKPTFFLLNVKPIKEKVVWNDLRPKWVLLVDYYI